MNNLIIDPFPQRLLHPTYTAFCFSVSLYKRPLNSFIFPDETTFCKDNLQFFLLIIQLQAFSLKFAPGTFFCFITSSQSVTGPVLFSLFNQRMNVLGRCQYHHRSRSPYKTSKLTICAFNIYRRGGGGVKLKSSRIGLDSRSYPPSLRLLLKRR